MDAAARELLFVLILIGVLTIFGVVAVFVFIRQWRRERLSNGREIDPRHSNPELDSPPQDER